MSTTETQPTAETVYYDALSLKCVEVAPNEFKITQIEPEDDFTYTDEEIGFSVDLPLPIGITIVGKVNKKEKYIEWGFDIMKIKAQRTRVGLDGGKIELSNFICHAEIRLYPKDNALWANVNVGTNFPSWSDGGDFHIVNL
ncbi:hypothetical protein H072_1756 [Dactylellina haptotyla CBS 200.50]|uniref:Uncharacterized protein n=1 Tax=Dactylellina haptotyla (strain CBS 200.50) TaxID=1284197 RepID=S8AMQ1_DACHA|nr:hypothetical protein H072_1756 [Dactylellina haptotyla CBS 200.50]